MAKIDFKKIDTYRKTFDGILQVKKHVGSEDDLPVTGAQNGDIYIVGENNSLYIYNGSWAPMGSGGGTTEHLVVHGKSRQEYGIMFFVPNDGQPTFSEAVEAFESGIPVLLVFSLDDILVSSRVLSHARSNEAVFLCVFSDERYVYWKSDANADPEPDPSPDPGPHIA